MKDNKNDNESTAKNESKLDNSSLAAEGAAKQEKTVEKPKKSGGLATALALLAIVLTILWAGFSAYIYKENKVLTAQQQSTIDKLNTQLSSQSSSQNQQTQQLQQTLTQQSTFETQIEQVNTQLQQVKNENKIYSTDVQSLQRSFAETTVRHPNDWILAEVEYLVRLSGSKIWLEKDIPTAISLLLAADQRIVELNDASLNTLRAALLEDITTLEALPKTDPDGVVLALSGLERRIEKLEISGLQIAANEVTQEEEISSDINDWQANLGKSWTAFVDSFIVINKREEKVEALLSPQQTWYLKENLRGYLTKAEFAIYREQQDIYDLAMSNAKSLLTNYYDLTDNTTSHFYTSIQRLSKHTVSVEYPDQLKSAPLLERVMKQRIKKSLASSRVE
ncbi:MAG: uroporphyrinogen-III C-methyltransferase [Psychromonas sp.]